MTPQVSVSPAPSIPASPVVAAASPSPAPAPGASPVATQPARAAVPLPSMKPGEVITWVKFERPKLALGEIVVGSFALAGVLLVVAMVAGIVLGHFRSKRTSDTHGAGGLGLR